MIRPKKYKLVPKGYGTAQLVLQLQGSSTGTDLAPEQDQLGGPQIMVPNGVTHQACLEVGLTHIIIMNIITIAITIVILIVVILIAIAIRAVATIMS